MLLYYYLPHYLEENWYWMCRTYA